MQCYIGGRGSGKTQCLINMSHDTGIPIVARTAHMANAIERQAMRMGKPIPKPISCGSPEMLTEASLQQRVLVDEVGGILEDFLGAHVVAASIDGDALRLANPALGGFESMGFFELMRTWHNAKKTSRE